jgi:hypothetical protein
MISEDDDYDFKYCDIRPRVIITKSPRKKPPVSLKHQNITNMVDGTSRVNSKDESMNRL